MPKILVAAVSEKRLDMNIPELNPIRAIITILATAVMIFTAVHITK